MKVWGLALVPFALGGSALLTTGCAATRSPGQVNAMAGEAAYAGWTIPSRPAPAPLSTLSPETRSFVDRLRADDSYRPAPTGGDGTSSWVQFAPGAYIAQGWPWTWMCRLSRPRDCGPTRMICEPRYYSYGYYGGYGSCPPRYGYPRCK